MVVNCGLQNGQDGLPFVLLVSPDYITRSIYRGMRMDYVYFHIAVLVVVMYNYIQGHVQPCTIGGIPPIHTHTYTHTTHLPIHTREHTHPPTEGEGEGERERDDKNGLVGASPV